MPKKRVEDYLVTPETVQFSKNYKNQLRGYKYLRETLMRKAGELKAIADATKAQGARLRTMLTKRPRDLVNPLAHQPREGAQEKPSSMFDKLGVG